MSDPLHDVVFDGRIAPGHEKGAVRRALLAKRLLPLETLDRALGGEPIHVGSGVSREEAGRLRDEFRNTGALCRVVPHAEGKASRPVGPSSAADPERRRPFASPLLIPVCAVLLLILGFFALRSKSPGSEPSALAAAAARDAAAGADAPGSVAKPTGALRVAAGETGSFEVSGYLPFVHREDISPSVEASFRLTANDFETLGVRASCESASIEPVSVSLWEYVDDGGRTYVPGLTPGGLGMSPIVGPSTELNERFAATAFFRGEVSKVVASGESGEDDFRKTLAGLPVAQVQRGRYRAYRAHIRFSLSIPDTPDFGADRRGGASLWLGSDGVQIDYPEGRVAVSIRTDALVELARGGSKAGVTIVNGPGSDGKDWVVTDR